MRCTPLFAARPRAGITTTWSCALPAVTACCLVLGAVAATATRSATAAAVAPRANTLLEPADTVPGYLAREAGGSFKRFIPNDSMICNFT